VTRIWLVRGFCARRKCVLFKGCGRRGKTYITRVLGGGGRSSMGVGIPGRRKGTYWDKLVEGAKYEDSFQRGRNLFPFERALKTRSVAGGGSGVWRGHRGGLWIR